MCLTDFDSMTGGRRKPIERHLDERELDRLLAETDDDKMIRRLVFVKNLYRGDTITEAASRVGKSRATGSRWANRWNDGGLDALAPDFGGGRPPKLDEEEREKLLERLHAGQPWHPRDVRRLLEEEFDVEYHPSYMSEFLRSLGVRYTPVKGEPLWPDVLDESEDDEGVDSRENNETGSKRGGWTFETDGER